MPQNTSPRKARPRLTSAHRLPAPPPYDRHRDLPRILPMWPHEIDDMTPEKHLRLLQRLRRALREERRRGIAGSWTYDLARHARLFRALQAEIAATPPPLSSWVAAGLRDEAPTQHSSSQALSRAPDATTSEATSGLSLSACQAPSSSQVASGLRHSSAPPSDSRAGAATWPDTPRATSCSASAGVASAT